MANNIKGITVEIGGNVEPLNRALKGVNSTAKSLQSELNMVNKALKLDPTNIDLIRQKHGLLKEAISNTRDKLDTLKEAQKLADQQMKDGIEVDQEQYRKLQREIAFTEQQLSDYRDELKLVHISLSDVGNAIGKVGEASQSLGKKLMPVTGVILALGTGATVSASQFEDSMAKVSTIADATAVPIEDLESAIIELSNQTGISSSDIAQNVYDAISAGQQTGDAVNFVSNATMLAKAGFTETGNALDILTTIMNAYGLEAEEVRKVSDTLIQTQNLGKTTVAELSSNMGKVIPTAKANGVALDQVATSYAIMTANGISTAETTTYVNSMLNELGKGGTKVDKILRKKTGKSFKQLMDSGLSLADALGIINDYANKSNQSFSDLWSSSEAGKAGLVLFGDGAEIFNSKLQEMNQSTGATEEAFAKMDTTSNQTKIIVNLLKNTLMELGQTILDNLQPFISEVSDKVKQLTDWFSSLDEKQRENILTISLVIGAIAPLLIIFGKVASGISSIIGVLTSLKSMIGFVKTAFVSLNAVMAANPIGVVIISIVALIAGFVLLYNKCEWLRDGVNTVWNCIKEVFVSTWETVCEFFTITVPNAIETLVTSIQDFFVNAWETIVTFFTERIPSFINSILQWLEELPYNIGHILGIIIGKTIQFGADMINWVKTEIPLFVSKFVGFMKELPSKIWHWLTETFSKVKKFGSDMYHKAAEIGGNFIRNIIEFIKELPSDIWEWLKKTIQKVKDFGKDLYKRGKEAGKELFDSIVESVKELPGRMMEIGGDIVRGVWDGICNMGEWLKEKVSSFFSGIVDGVKGVLGIHSPSRVMADEVGRHMPTGVAQGIDETSDVVEESVDSMLNDTLVNARRMLSDTSGFGISLNAAIGQGTSQSRTSNHYGQNYIEIHCNSVDMDNLDDICNEINYRLGMAY